MNGFRYLKEPEGDDQSIFLFFLLVCLDQPS